MNPIIFTYIGYIHDNVDNCESSVCHQCQKNDKWHCAMLELQEGALLHPCLEIWYALFLQHVVRCQNCTTRPNNKSIPSL